MKKLKTKIIDNLSDDLLKKEYLNSPNKNKYTGHCYIASETYYHLSHEKLKIYYVKHENSTHWYLRNERHDVIDLTAKQFKTPVPYFRGRRASFLTNYPSKRCKILIKRVLDELETEKEETAFNKSFEKVSENIVIPISYNYNETGKIVYDFEEMTNYFNTELSKLRTY